MMISGLPDNSLDTEEFRNKFTRFLFGTKGSKHRLLLGFDQDMECGEPAPHMTMSMLQFTHHLMEGPKEQIPAMNWVKETIKEANFTNRVFPMCIGYASWETDEVMMIHHKHGQILISFCLGYIRGVVQKYFLGHIMCLDHNLDVTVQLYRQFIGEYFYTGKQRTWDYVI